MTGRRRVVQPHTNVSIRPITYVCNVCVGVGCMMCGAEGLSFRHEFGPTASHRIVVIISSTGQEAFGDFVPFQSIATIKLNGHNFYAFSSFWAGTFSSDKVYRVVPTDAPASDVAV